MNVHRARLGGKRDVVVKVRNNQETTEIFLACFQLVS
jgi:starvation-inducible outer membrane lipoprotein